MAERLNKLHTENVKQKIKASQLLNFVQDHALDGTPADKTRIDAAKFLLERILARAEAQKDIHLTGQLTLNQLIEQTLSGP